MSILLYFLLLGQRLAILKRAEVQVHTKGRNQALNGFPGRYTTKEKRYVTVLDVATVQPKRSIDGYQLVFSTCVSMVYICYYKRKGEKEK